MKYLSLLAIMVVVAGCTPQKTEEEKVDLKTRVMNVHDEVMPKMGELRQTQKELLTLADSTVSDSVMAAKYKELAHNIELANEAMMDWMRHFNPNFEGSEEEIKEYLEGQLEGIERVKKDMNQSLEEGKRAL